MLTQRLTKTPARYLQPGDVTGRRLLLWVRTGIAPPFTEEVFFGIGLLCNWLSDTKWIMSQ
jgi:hypothetical protein